MPIRGVWSNNLLPPRNRQPTNSSFKPCWCHLWNHPPPTSQLWKIWRIPPENCWREPFRPRYLKETLLTLECFIYVDRLVILLLLFIDRFLALDRSHRIQVERQTGPRMGMCRSPHQHQICLNCGPLQWSSTVENVIKCFIIYF